MTHVVLTGLFLAAALVASPVFAGDESSMCQINLQHVRDAKVSKPNMSEQLKGDIDTTLHRAEAALARNSDDGAKECLSLVNQAMQKVQSN